MHENTDVGAVRDTGAAVGPRLLGVLAWLWLLVALAFLTDASCCFLIALPLAGIWLGLGVAWALLPLLSPASLATWRGRQWYASAAVAGLLGFVLALTDLGVTTRVAVSDQWLTAYVTGVAPGTWQTRHEPRWVGLFRVEGTVESDGAVMLFTSQDFIDSQGVAYIPPGKDLPSRYRVMNHLYGSWYTFNHHF